LATSVQELTQSGEQSPVRRPQRWACYLAAQHRHFVSEHDDFDGQFFAITPEETD